MTEILDISLKNIKNVDDLIKLCNDIHQKLTELKKNKDENGNIIILLKKKYFNI